MVFQQELLSGGVGSDPSPLAVTPELLSSASAWCWMNWLQRRLDWREEYFSVAGQLRPAPRLSTWFGPPYRYSGWQHGANPWPDFMKPLLKTVQHQTGVQFNSVLTTLYRDGTDHVGWHADSEAILGKSPTIAVLSLGTSRTLCIRKMGEGKTRWRELLTHGSLAVMPAGFQSLYQHRVQKSTKIHDARISLSFRWVHSS